jgi:cob(I)alamin adenosyltransferase
MNLSKMPIKIYTKTGDAGNTALFGGRRVAKSHLRVDAYGTVDELNAFIGVLRDACSDMRAREVLFEVQNRLFTLGAHLASDPAKHPPTPDLLPADLSLLEQEIDRMDAGLPTLKNFILPGGHPTVSHCHVCRTVCRRAERLVVALHKKDPVDPMALQYLNRLSDYFFVLCRQLAQDLGAEEVIWKMR